MLHTSKLPVFHNHDYVLYTHKFKLFRIHVTMTFLSIMMILQMTWERKLRKGLTPLEKIDLNDGITF